MKNYEKNIFSYFFNFFQGLTEDPASLAQVAGADASANKKKWVAIGICTYFSQFFSVFFNFMKKLWFFKKFKSKLIIFCSLLNRQNFAIIRYRYRRCRLPRDWWYHSGHSDVLLLDLWRHQWGWDHRSEFQRVFFWQNLCKKIINFVHQILCWNNELWINSSFV